MTARHVFTFDTNAGPIVTIRAASLDEAKLVVESQIPLLNRRGYTSRWEPGAGEWHVIFVSNSRGRVVHRAAIRPGELRTRPPIGRPDAQDDEFRRGVGSDFS